MANLVRTIHADAQRGNDWQFCEFHASLRLHVTRSSFLIDFRGDISGTHGGSQMSILETSKLDFRRDSSVSNGGGRL